MNIPVSPTLESPVPTETNLQKEQKLFGELFRRLVNAVINSIFDMRPIRAVQRMQYLFFLFCLSILLITFTHQDYTLYNWSQNLRNLFLYLFNSDFRANYPSNAVNDFLYFVWNAFTDPHTLQYIPIFLAPFFIGLQSAAIYLADVFELEDVSIARKFIWEVALSGSNEVIRVKEGEVSEEYRHSPAFLIGGPGKVIVDLDSAALFEKPDGTPHIIGPTGREPGGRASLDGFERFRQAIDIRDHYVDLRDQDPRSQSVKSRSRDGMPITATDVRLMFSVYRGENPKRTNQFPYPFSPEAIEKIVYKASSRVTPDQPNPSAFEFSWVNNMVGLIRGRLGTFMSERKLSDYLASIGLPEFEKAKQNEEKIAAQIRELTQQTDANLQQNEIKPPPTFTPRYKITNLFSEFAEDFTRSARNSGVELHWIGVGTWKTPVEIVPEKHLEAWKITQDNLGKGSDEALKKSENEAMLQKTASLIRSVPLESYEQISGAGRSGMRRRPGPSMGTRRDIIKKEPETSTDLTLAESGLSSDSMDADVLSSLMIMQAFQGGGRRSYSSEYYDLDHDGAMKMLLLEYRKQLIEAVEFMKARNETVPPKIEEAINHINDQSGWQHWVGR